MVNEHDIAIELEYMLQKEFGFADRPCGTIFDADYIEKEMFYDDMTLLLYKKGKMDFTEFLDIVHQYRRMNMNTIPNCDLIFEQFKRLL